MCTLRTSNDTNLHTKVTSRLAKLLARCQTLSYCTCLLQAFPSRAACEEVLGRAGVEGSQWRKASAPLFNPEAVFQPLTRRYLVESDIVLYPYIEGASAWYSRGPGGCPLWQIILAESADAIRTLCGRDLVFTRSEMSRRWKAREALVSSDADLAILVAHFRLAWLQGLGDQWPESWLLEPSLLTDAIRGWHDRYPALGDAIIALIWANDEQKIDAIQKAVWSAYDAEILDDIRSGERPRISDMETIRILPALIHQTLMQLDERTKSKRKKADLAAGANRLDLKRPLGTNLAHFERKKSQIRTNRNNQKQS